MKIVARSHKYYGKATLQIGVPSTKITTNLPVSLRPGFQKEIVVWRKEDKNAIRELKRWWWQSSRAFLPRRASTGIKHGHMSQQMMIVFHKDREETNLQEKPVLACQVPRDTQTWQDWDRQSQHNKSTQKQQTASTQRWRLWNLSHTVYQHGICAEEHWANVLHDKHSMYLTSSPPSNVW